MHQLARRRTIYLVAIALGLPLLAFTWLGHQAVNPVIRYGHLLLAVYLLWAFVALWRGVPSLRRVEQSTFVVLCCLWLGNYTHSLYSGVAFQASWAQFMVSVMLNFFILGVVAHLAFDTRLGLRINLALLTVSSSLGLARLLPDALQGVHQQELAWLMQFQIALGIFMSFVYVVAKSKDDYLVAELNARALRTIAYQDELTGLPNRRRLAAELDRQVEISQRYVRPLALISFDLDHFKQVNDCHGHAVGDEVLAIVASTVQPLLRASDTFGRWGGEEFLIVAAETDLADAYALADRIREAIASASFPQQIQLTASFGVITRQEGDSAMKLLDAVDQQLYAAKEQGRNRVAGEA